MRLPARVIGALLVVSLAGCEAAPVQGRFHRGLAWIEFRADSTVLHGELGDAARVEFDRDDAAN